MTQQPFPNPPVLHPLPPPLPPAPPVSGGPGWPKALGWVSVGLACFYLAMCSWGLVKKVDLNTFRPEAREKIEGWYRNRQPVLSVFALAMNGTLLAGGICLLKRRRAARPLHLAYGVMAILASFPGAYVTMLVTQSIALPASPYSAQIEASIAGALIVSMVLGMALAWAYPIFLFIWFNRRRAKADMAAW